MLNMRKAIPIVSCRISLTPTRMAEERPLIKARAAHGLVGMDRALDTGKTR